MIDLISGFALQFYQVIFFHSLIVDFYNKDEIPRSLFLVVIQMQQLNIDNISEGQLVWIQKC